MQYEQDLWREGGKRGGEGGERGERERGERGERERGGESNNNYKNKMYIILYM